MSIHNTGFYGELTKLSFIYHQKSSNTFYIYSSIPAMLCVYGPDRSVSNNQVSSVTLNDLTMKGRESIL